MRWMRFEIDGNISYGIVEGESVKAVDGDPFEGYQETDKSHGIADVKLLIPLVPKTFYAAGLNYVAHIEEQERLHGRKINLPQKADVGYRANNSLIAHGETIILPKDVTEKVEYEGELVVVIGKKAKNITEAEALDYVLGFTIGNDLSERNWQKEDRTMWRAKNTDTFAPMGPWIDTDAKLEDMKTIVSVNGEEKIRFETNNMLFSVEHYMSTISKYIELQPGDVLWMGTEGDSQNLVHGDVVDIEITGIGTLSNPIIKES
jgi:2-keto-4-pentenoate hydratase/2-oxohepta-3-ene-1,7-dioic acid hydratase in catechol pathway